MYKIALVEDEKNLAALVIKYLEAEKFEVDWYSNGETAEKNIDKKYHDILSDIQQYVNAYSHSYIIWYNT